VRNVGYRFVPVKSGAAEAEASLGAGRGPADGPGVLADGDDRTRLTPADRLGPPVASVAHVDA
jgi:hypothetical protein